MKALDNKILKLEIQKIHHDDGSAECEQKHNARIQIDGSQDLLFRYGVRHRIIQNDLFFLQCPDDQDKALVRMNPE